MRVLLDAGGTRRTLGWVMKLASRQPLPVSELEVAISTEARLRRRYARRGRVIPRLRVVWSASTVFAVVLGALSFLYATSHLLHATTTLSQH